MVINLYYFFFRGQLASCPYNPPSSFPHSFYIVLKKVYMYLVNIKCKFLITL